MSRLRVVGPRIEETPPSAARVVVVADTHLSDRSADADRNWARVVDHLRATPTDLVVHAGDISADGAERHADLEHARDQLARVDAPMHVLPGNHDLGDNPFGARPDDVIDRDRLDRYRDVFGADRWCVEIGAWRLLGINAQLFRSGLLDEVEQWSWLEARLTEALAADQPVVLFLHKPVSVLDPFHDDMRTPIRYVPPGSRQRVERLVHQARVGLVVSGHVHQRRAAAVDGVTHVWTPSTWAVLPDLMQPRLGEKRCVLVALALHPDGSFDVSFVEPQGLQNHEIAVPMAHAGYRPF